MDKDFAAMARLRRQTIRHINAQDYPPEIIDNWAKRTCAQDFRNNAHIYERWVMWIEEKITGFCEHNLQGELTRIYVHKDYLRKGMGTRLLKTAEAAIKKLGFAEITIAATVTAKAFYKSHGYKIIEKTTAQIDGACIYKMRKKIC